ncbi:MAG: hypothetical protein NVS9B8_05330 [Candidatus Limnocylindrales bacterium]
MIRLRALVPWGWARWRVDLAIESPPLLMSEHHQRSEGSHLVSRAGSNLTPRPAPVSRTYLDAIIGCARPVPNHLGRCLSTIAKRERAVRLSSTGEERRVSR